MIVQNMQNQSTPGISGTATASGPGSAYAVTGALDSSGSLLPPPSLAACTGDIGAEIAMLGVRVGNDTQHIETVAEQTEDKVQDSAEAAEVKDMHQEASDIMSSAVAAGAMQICQGATQMAGAGAPAGEQGAYTGTATMFGAASTLLTAGGQATQQIDQAQVTSDKAVADRAGQLSSEASQGQQDAKSIISNAIQFFQQYEQAKAQIDLCAAGQKA